MLWCPITFDLLHPLSDDQKWSLPWDYQQINCTYSSQNVKHEWFPSCKPPLHLVADFEYLLVADFSFCLSSRARQASHPCTSWVLQPSSPTMTFSGWAGNIGYPQVWCQTSSNVVKRHQTLQTWISKLFHGHKLVSTLQTHILILLHLQLEFAIFSDRQAHWIPSREEVRFSLALGGSCGPWVNHGYSKKMGVCSSDINNINCNKDDTFLVVLWCLLWSV